MQGLILSITREEQKLLRKTKALFNLYFHITKNQKGTKFPKGEDKFLIIHIFECKRIRPELWIQNCN